MIDDNSKPAWVRWGGAALALAVAVLLVLWLRDVLQSAKPSKPMKLQQITKTLSCLILAAVHAAVTRPSAKVEYLKKSDGPFFCRPPNVLEGQFRKRRKKRIAARPVQEGRHAANIR